MSVFKSELIILVLTITLNWENALGQEAATEPIEIRKCTEYKTQVYSKTFTYGHLLPGLPVLSTQIDTCKKYEPFIVDGEPAKPKEFPLMARLGNFDESISERGIKWFCGGSLISEKWILTAAHCFVTLYGEVNRARLGELDFGNDLEDAQPEDFEVIKNIEHPGYNNITESSYNDIGLVELSKNVKFSEYKVPACLASSTGDSYSQFIAIGWGSTRFASIGSKKLLKVKLDRFDSNTCQNIVEKETKILPRGLLDDIQVCAGSANTRKDTCNGDSGGPLLAYHSYPCMYTIVGITSSGFGGCGTPNVPAVYTRVYYYLDWIKSYVWPEPKTKNVFFSP